MRKKNPQYGKIESRKFLMLFSIASRRIFLCQIEWIDDINFDLCGRRVSQEEKDFEM